MTPSPTTENDHAAAVSEMERQFAALFVQARRAIRERAALIHPDLTVLGFHTLSTLVRRGPQQQSHLADWLSVDKAAMSRTVTHLVDLGLADRSQDPRDRRAQQIAVTDDGQSRFEMISAHQRAHLHERLGTWPAEDVRQLAGLLARFNETAADGD
ncbi:MarR family winged helix-turn-helix transcriptional regulator [Ruania alba]|uniref:MarR family winged helix-turn-helix transcriptional regulator n=1 Tax=Ruania alba TaxID=648782 RepID=UPI00158702A4|nr:MarR family transcriptional regulator [Ruania alba]